MKDPKAQRAKAKEVAEEARGERLRTLAAGGSLSVHPRAPLACSRRAAAPGACRSLRQQLLARQSRARLSARSPHAPSQEKEEEEEEDEEEDDEEEEDEEDEEDEEEEEGDEGAPMDADGQQVCARARAAGARTLAAAERRLAGLAPGRGRDGRGRGAGL
jgi:cobalamin biosynthesis protein CobT